MSRSTDADLTKALTQFFPNDKDESVTGERVHAAHILLKTTKENEEEQKKKIDALYERLQKGEDFGKLARATSEDSTRSTDGDLGFFGKGAMVKEFEAAAFSLRPGNISKPIKSQFGFHIIKLLDHIPAGPRTVERLKAELKYRWTHDRLETPEGNQAITQEAQEILKGVKDKAAKAKSLADVKGDAKVRFLKTAALSASDPIPALPDGAQLVRAAQALSEGAISDPMGGFLSKNHYLVRAAKIYPPASPQYANVRAKISEDVMKERRQEALTGFARKLLKEWKDAKKPFAALAKVQKLEVRETGAFARSPLGRVPGVGVSPAAMAGAFLATAENSILADPVVSGSRIYLLALKEHMAPDWALFNKDREQLRKVAEDELGNQRVQLFTQSLRSNAKIIRHAAVTQSDAM